MRVLVLSHQNGARVNQKEIFPLQDLKELIIGRDAVSCAVVCDDTVVSRNHAKIMQDTGAPERFTLLDLASANGTFVNGVRVAERASVGHGDSIRLGSEGPVLLLELDPPPAEPGRAKAAAAGAASSLEATRIERPPDADAGPLEWWKTRFERVARPHRSGPGLETRLQRMETARRKDWRVIAGLLGFLALLLVILVVVLTADLKSLFPRNLSPDGIATANREAVSRIEFTWKALDNSTGGQVFHWYVRNPHDGSGGPWEAIRGTERVPVYVRLGDGSIEPVLIPDDERHTNLPIGGQGSGTGFTVHPSGFIVTDRRVAAPWTDPYEWPRESAPGILIDLAAHTQELLQTPPPGWVPARARFVVNRIPRLDAIVAGEARGEERVLQGRPDVLNAVLAGGMRLRASVERTLDTDLAALIRVAPVGSLPAVKLASRETAPARGASVVALGYGGAGADRGPALSAVPVQLRISPSPARTESCADCMAVEGSSLAAPMDGAPLFNSRGEVVGMAGSARSGAARMPVAVPSGHIWRLIGAGK
jgi:hypothetical protein